MTWVNQPRQWRGSGRDLHVRTEEGSDFWRMTGNGEDHDSGHAFLAREKGDLVAEVTVRADLAAAHDQAGLMLRVSGWAWVKFAVQLVRGSPYATATATRDGSDWSVHPLPGGGSSPVRLRMERTGNAVSLHCAAEADLERQAAGHPEPWHLLRVVPFPAAMPVGIGPMCASPRRAGLEVMFTGCEIQTAGPSWLWLG